MGLILTEYNTNAGYTVDKFRVKVFFGKYTFEI